MIKSLLASKDKYIRELEERIQAAESKENEMIEFIKAQKSDIMGQNGEGIADERAKIVQ